MKDFNGEELVRIEDIFENDTLVVMKETYKPVYDKVIRTSIGIKDSTGNIVKIATVDQKYYY